MCVSSEFEPLHDRSTSCCVLRVSFKSKAGLLYTLLDGSSLLDDTLLLLDVVLLLDVRGATLLNALLLDAEDDDDIREP